MQEMQWKQVGAGGHGSMRPASTGKKTTNTLAYGTLFSIIADIIIK
jgi:hypothetical protein